MSLGQKQIRIGEAVNFAADWTDWLDTDRDGTAEDTITSAVAWSIQSGGSGLTVGSTSRDANNLIATAKFTCAATVTKGTTWVVRCTAPTTTGGETFIREGTIVAVDG